MLIGIDVGGTHTDGVCILDSRVQVAAKVPTDHDNLLGTITEVLRSIVRDCPGEDIRTINLSTTLSTNTIVTNRAEQVGMFVIPGPGIDAQAYALGDHYYSVGGAWITVAPFRPKFVRNISSPWPERVGMPESVCTELWANSARAILNRNPLLPSFWLLRPTLSPRDTGFLKP